MTDPNIPKRVPFEHPQLKEFAPGDAFQSEDGKTVLMIVDFKPGESLGIGIWEPETPFEDPAVMVQITGPNPDLAELSAPTDETREQMGLEEMGAPTKPATISKTEEIEINDFLKLIKGFNKI